MKKYLSSIILIIIFIATAWAIIYEKNRAEKLASTAETTILKE